MVRRRRDCLGASGGLGGYLFDRVPAVTEALDDFGRQAGFDDHAIGPPLMVEPRARDGFGIFNIQDSTSGSNPPTVELIGLTLTGADSAAYGGAIHSEGRLTITNSTITKNHASFGGAVFQSGAGSVPPASLTIRENSVISDNQASDGGGGIWSNGKLTVRNSEISGNHARDGGGAMTAQLVNGVAAADSTKFCAIWSLAV